MWFQLPCKFATTTSVHHPLQAHFSIFIRRVTPSIRQNNVIKSEAQNCAMILKTTSLSSVSPGQQDPCNTSQFQSNSQPTNSNVPDPHYNLYCYFHHVHKESIVPKATYPPRPPATAQKAVVSQTFLKCPRRILDPANDPSLIPTTTKSLTPQRETNQLQFHRCTA